MAGYGPAEVARWVAEPPKRAGAANGDRGPFVRDRALLAELVQLARTRRAQPRLERPRRVVDAGVDHAARVAGLVEADVVLLLEHRHAQVRRAPRELARRRQAEDSGADDGDVALVWW